MENASKALLIAGGILLAILVISLFAVLFNNLRDYQDSQEDAKYQEQVVRYNNPYTAYDRDGITLNEIKSLYNMIESNNIKANNGESGYYHIQSNIKDLCLKPTNNDEKIDITISNFLEVEERLKNNKYSFKCEEIKFDNEGGRISSMKFSMTDLIGKVTYQSNKFE